MRLVRAVKITDIKINEEYLARWKLDRTRVRRLRDRIMHDAELPPVLVVRFRMVLVLADGWHRIEAHLRAGKLAIPSIIVEGDEYRIAFMAFYLNRRTLKRGERRRAVKHLMQKPALFARSNRFIARLVGCTHRTVQGIRHELEKRELIPRLIRRQCTRQHSCYTMRVDRPGRRDQHER